MVKKVPINDVLQELGYYWCKWNRSIVFSQVLVTFFYTHEMCAFNRKSCNVPVSSEHWKRRLRPGARLSEHSLKTLSWILSGPGALETLLATADSMIVTLEMVVSHSTETAGMGWSDRWYVDGGGWVIHDGVGEGHGCWKVAKMADFIVAEQIGPRLWNWPFSQLSICSANMHAIKRLTVNYDTLRQYLNFNRTYFWYSSPFSVT